MYRSAKNGKRPEFIIGTPANFFHALICIVNMIGRKKVCANPMRL